ncbi:MAG: flagellar biosynthetic protein FliR [Gammaproteobacteria bacterium]|nr:flagellar biosynthetic protein FliR [Gammaproteobacteria bacterium]
MDDLAGALSMAGLLFARCGGVLAVVPPLNVRGLPVTLRLGLAAVLAVALLPVAREVEGLEAAPPAGYLALLLQEAAIGLAAGFAGALVYWAFLIAGQLLDSLLGAGSAAERSAGRGPIAGFVYVLAAVALAAFDRVAPGLGLAQAAPAVRWTSGLLGLIVTVPLLGPVIAAHGLRAAEAVQAAFRMLAG